MNKKVDRANPYEHLVHTITAEDDPEYCLDFAIGDYAKISYHRGSHTWKINKILDLVMELKGDKELSKKEILYFYYILEEELKKEGKW
ncbi:hypothetical protein ES705_38486 [subsurface metagenome]